MDSVWESASGDRDVISAGGIDRLGSLILTGKKTVLKSAKVSAHGSGRGTSGAGAWTCPVYRAGKRERDYGLLQCLAAQIRGDVAVGAMTILSSAMQFSMLPMQGLGQGAQPITSYNYGARNADALKKDIPSAVDHKPVLFDGGMAFNHAVSADVCNDFFLQRRAIAYTKWALRIYCAAMGIFGAQIACQMTFISIGNAGASIIVAIMRKFVLLLPLIYLLPHLVKIRPWACIWQSRQRM